MPLEEGPERSNRQQDETTEIEAGDACSPRKEDEQAGSVLALAAEQVATQAMCDFQELHRAHQNRILPAPAPVQQPTARMANSKVAHLV